MHFAKTYPQLLLSLPPDLREHAIQYRQLKKLINHIVQELSSLGLSPAVLHELLEHNKNEAKAVGGHFKAGIDDSTSSESSQAKLPYLPRIVYEVDAASRCTEPRMRLLVEAPIYPTPDYDSDRGLGGRNDMLWALQQASWVHAHQQDGTAIVKRCTVHTGLNDPVNPAPTPAPGDGGMLTRLVIPLVSDTAFFQTLSLATHHLSAHLSAIQSDFLDSLGELSDSISDSARPASSVSKSFHPFSITSNARKVGVSSDIKGSDLYTWRTIFQLYVEAEVFENVSEVQRGERSIEESELRLKSFAQRVMQRGLGDHRTLKKLKSRSALETFLELNLVILNIKRFQYANAEAMRKILKKHTKRTALPEPPSLVLRAQSISLPRVLVQAIGETLLPVIPHLDDYTCLICTSIAFKPIRLNCGHLFCVRCLVKMQKRGKVNCPLCRAPCVLIADRTNVDWALMNFMRDWFPVESKQKQKENEKEAGEEQLKEMGFDPDQKCIVM